MIDTHCHLTDPRLGAQLEGVFQRAKALGVNRFITIGTSLADSRAAVQLCRSHSQVRCAVGVHPNYTADERLEDFPQLREIQNDAVVAAIGEIGLDYFHEQGERRRQHEAFETQLAIAAELSRPVVIHSREAIADTLAHMRNHPTIRAVFHCFTGTTAEAEAILTAGYLIGFTGPITYKKNDALRDIVRQVPQERLLIETDAPYLTPEPMRKHKVNEPGWVHYVAQTVAAERGWTQEETDRITTANAEKFFGWT